MYIGFHRIPGLTFESPSGPEPHSYVVFKVVNAGSISLSNNTSMKEFRILLPFPDSLQPTLRPPEHFLLLKDIDPPGGLPLISGVT